MACHFVGARKNHFFRAICNEVWKNDAECLWIAFSQLFFFAGLRQMLYGFLYMIFESIHYSPFTSLPLGLGLNHYIPVWREEDLEPDVVEKLRNSTHQEIASLKQMLQTGNARTHGAFWVSLAETMGQRLEALRTFAVLQSSLKLQNLVAAEVPADGNCGAWSIMNLVTGDPFLAAAAQNEADKQQKYRNQIAEQWTSVSKDPQWQAVYMSLMDLFDHVPEAEEKEKPEPRTPIPKKKLAKPLFVDLSTPPKEASGGKKPDVITDGAGRGAFPVKAPLPNPTFGGALPDEDAEQDEDDEQDEAAEPEVSTDDSEAEGKGQSAKGRGRGRGRGRGKARRRGRARGRGRAQGHGGKKASAKEKIGKVVTEMQGGPKRKSKKKAVVKPPKKKSCEGEGKDGQEGDKEEEPKRRKRKCKQKVKTDDDKRLAAVQSYLGSLGLTWSFCQSYHARRGFAESVSGKCKGFLAWQNKLGIDFVEPECLLCLSMIREKQFNMEVVRGLVEEALLPFKESPAWKHLRQLNETVLPWIEPQENVMEDGAATECLDIVPYKPPEQDGDQADQEEGQAGENVAREPVNPGLIIIRLGQAHVLQALPNSNRGRMCKIRCRVCRSKQQPNGRTFQCNTSRANDIRHFIKQHLKGPNHIANMARWAQKMQREQEQDGEPEPVADTHHVPCQGACLTTGQNRTSIFRSELLLWATMTQMKKALAKHTYFLDLSGEVIAFHENCLKALPQPEEGKRAVCVQCEDSLGACHCFFPMGTGRELRL